MNYKDNFGFFYKAKQTVYKWWCIVYKPTYKLFHHGYWPAEKEPYYQMNQAKANEEKLSAKSDATVPNAEDLASQILNSKQGNVDDMVANTTPINIQEETNSNSEPEVDLSTVDPDALARANEIMARLAAEAASDEAKKQAEIDAAKAKAEEDARVASIMKAAKVDISAFIEEGKAQRNDTNS